LPKELEVEKAAFLNCCEYFAGAYNSAENMHAAAEKLAKYEKTAKPDCSPIPRL